jgi:hypothetical protein
LRQRRTERTLLVIRYSERWKDGRLEWWNDGETIKYLNPFYSNIPVFRGVNTDEIPQD